MNEKSLTIRYQIQYKNDGDWYDSFYDRFEQQDIAITRYKYLKEKYQDKEWRIVTEVTTTEVFIL